MNAMDLVIKYSCPYDVNTKLPNMDDYSIIRDKKSDRVVGCRNMMCGECWTKDSKVVDDEYYSQ